MKFKIRCIKYLARDRKWLLESGRIYEAEKRSDNEIDITNHYGQIVTLSLRDFHIYCLEI
jgi:hypothetical protein